MGLAIQPLFIYNKNVTEGHAMAHTTQERNTKEIDCPMHLNHKATLFCYGHRFEGVWECPVESISDVHEHDNYEDVGGMYICGGEEGCGVTIANRDPQEDRRQALAEEAMNCE